MPHAEYVPFIENVAQEQGEFFKEYGITQMD
jgi:hypothetical protein